MTPDLRKWRWLPTLVTGLTAGSMASDEADGDGRYFGVEWGHSYVEIVMLRRDRRWRS